MKTKNIMWIGIILIFLPSMVLAQNYIKDVRVWGDSNIDDLISPFGSFNVEVYVNIDGDSQITPNQVELGNSGIHVNSCTTDLNGVKCTYSEVLSDYIQGGQYSIQISLFDDNHDLVTQLSHSYIVDSIGPSVKLTTSKNWSNGSTIYANAQIKDTAFSGSSKCSGIKFVTVTLNNDEINQKDYTTKSCTLKLPLNITPDSSETQRVCVMAKDWADNFGNGSCITVSKDDTPPEVIEDSINFSFEFNFPYLGINQPYTTNFYFNVQEKHFDKDKVIVDFSQLNSLQDNYQLKPDSCEEINPNVHRCIINNVELRLPNETVNIIFDLTDKAGNNNIQTVPYSFRIDNNGPEAISMIINNQTAEPVYIGNVIESVKVNFNEEETGMLPQNVFLDVLGQTKIPAAYCEQNETLWICSWSNIQISQEGNLTISLDNDSTDAFGNKVKNTLSKTVIIDTTLPVLLNFSVEQPHNFLNLSENNTFLECQPIVMKAWLKEENPLLTVRLDPAFLVINTNETTNLTNQNTSSITGNIVLIPPNPSNPPSQLNPINPPNSTSDVTKECTQMGNGTYYCEYEIPCIPAGYYDANFIFEDIAKNKLVKNYTFDVWDVLDTPTDYFAIAGIERMPSAFDRSTTPYINHRILALVGLTRKSNGAGNAPSEVSTQDNVIPSSSNVKIVKIFTQGCSGDIQYVKNITLIDGSAQGEFPYFEIILKKMEIPRQNLTFKCNLSIYSLLTDSRGKHVSSIPETESVPIEIPFFETQLPKDVIQDKLDKIESNWLMQMDYLDGINSVLNYATNLCELYNSLIVLDEGLAITCNAFAPSCAGETGITGLRDSGFGKMALGACNYVTCKKTLWLNGFKEGDIDFWTGKKNPLWNQEATKNLWTEDNVKEWMNPKNSLTGSLAFGCIPGIVSNLEKLRSAQCSYAYCVKRMSDAGMLTAISYCDSMHSYAECKFWGGEMTYWIPPVQIVKQFGEMTQQALSDPVSTVLGIAGGLCQIIPASSQPLHSICMVTTGIPKALTAISDIVDFLTGRKSFSTGSYVDYCGAIGNG